MVKLRLKAQKRKILGSKVKKLRREGELPANIYGKKVKSQAVKVSMVDFADIYEKAGETNIVQLEVNGRKNSVLIHNVQIDPVTRNPLHADFHAVSLKEKISTEVPIELVGESKAVKEKKGTLITLLDEVEVEALPTDLPDSIKVDIEGLSEVDDSLKVKDLKVDRNVKILTEDKLDIVKIKPLVSKEAEELAVQEEAMAAEAKEEAVVEEEKAEEDKEKKAEEEEKDTEEDQREEK